MLDQMFDEDSFDESYYRPFAYALRQLRLRGYTYADLERRCGRVRSTAWFNNLVRSRDPWSVNPPPARAIPGLARLFGVSEHTVCQWIADEWYGAIPRGAA